MKRMNQPHNSFLQDDHNRWQKTNLFTYRQLGWLFELRG
jgi:hypothetical protein